MRWQGRRNRRGLSLLEILVAGSLMLLLLFGVINFTNQAALEWARGSSRVMSDDGASLALQKLAREIRDGMRARVDANGVLLVDMPRANNQGDYEPHSVGETLRFFVFQNNLMRSGAGGQAVLLAANVVSAAFSVEAEWVEIRLTTRQQMGQSEAQTTLGTRVTLRNYQQSSTP